jgi:hypothetical protein
MHSFMIENGWQPGSDSSDGSSYTIGALSLERIIQRPHSRQPSQPSFVRKVNELSSMPRRPSGGAKNIDIYVVLVWR